MFLFYLLRAGRPISTLFPYTTLFRSNWMRLHLGEPGEFEGRRLLSRTVVGEMHRAQNTIRGAAFGPDRKSTRLNSSHVAISYAVFCLKKKNKKKKHKHTRTISNQMSI